MKKLFFATLMLCALAAVGFAQAQKKADNSLVTAMEKFRTAIVKKDSTTVLGFISSKKGLTIMNTIDQGEAGNADKPMLSEKIAYKTLAADFKKKGEHYQNFFSQSEFGPSFYDNVLSFKGKWTTASDNKFMPIDETDKKPVKELYVKWTKEGESWKVTEIGRMIS